MEYRLYGIDHKTYVALHDYFQPRTVITSHVWNNDEQLFTITINTEAIITINAGKITIDFTGKTFDIEYGNYIGLATV